MKVYDNIYLEDFEAWGTARDILYELNAEECAKLESAIEQEYHEGINKTQLNDILCFDEAFVEAVIGRKLY